LKIQQQDVGGELPYGRDGFGAARSLTDNGELGMFVKQLPKALPENGVIVND
jgi:hypothetical protein